MSLRALIFDVDGTLAETEEAHRTAFNLAFTEAGLKWHWDKPLYRELLQITGGRERIRHFTTTIGETVSDAAVTALHHRKNALYAERVDAGGLTLRPGIARVTREAMDAGVRLGIATTTSRANLIALLDRLLPNVRFDAIVVGEDVLAKKPDPEAYRLVLRRLAMPAQDCVAIEDSRNGLRAARACGIATVVTPSAYTDHEAFTGAALVRASLDGPPPVDLACLEALASPLARAS